jgi:hypothetical protein
MRLNLVDDWRSVLKRAWSIRFLGVAIALSLIEAALPLLGGFVPPFVHLILAAVTPIVIAAAGIARLLVQRSLTRIIQAEREPWEE